jgi:hypothetical protein
MHLAEAVPIVIMLILVGRTTRLRYLRRRDLPGLPLILLAGRRHRAHMRSILDRRAEDEEAPGA